MDRRAVRAAIMGRMDGSVAWRAGLLMAGSIAVVAIALGAALSRDFFEDYGWAAGPGAWAVCALLVAAVLRLPALPVLAGAALAGLPGLVGVLLGAHWVGPPFGIVLFALWCGRLARVGDGRGGAPAVA
jgi:hypothetical protein